MGNTSSRISPSSRTRSAMGVAYTRRMRSTDIACDPGFTALSRREREVLALIALGMTDRQIADELIVSRVTVSTHVAHILDKLGVPNRTAAATVAATARYAGLGGD